MLLYDGSLRLIQNAEFGIRVISRLINSTLYTSWRKKGISQTGPR
jgi:hypothetical protein